MTITTHSLSDLVDPIKYTKKDGTIDYDALFNLFPFDQFAPNEAQSIRLPETYIPNQFSSVYRSARSPNYLIDKVAPELTTLHDHFEKSVHLHPNDDCMGTRLRNTDGNLDAEYTFQTLKQIQIRRDNLGSGIKTLVGRPSKENYIVSIFSSNRAEWLISSLAIQAFGLTSTALYDTLGPNTSKYILNLTESPLLIASYENLLKIINFKKGDGLPHLKYLISMDDLHFERDSALITLTNEVGLKLLPFKQVEQIGKLNPVPLERPNEVFCISFTSGTTGDPKGVIVTQKMAVAGIAFIFGHMDKPTNTLKPTDKQVRYFSFLPLAHIYELMDIYAAVSSNYKIYFPFDPSPLKILDHLKLIKPHYVCLVPRVYTKFESALKQSLSESLIGRNMISKAIKKKYDKGIKNGGGGSVILDNFISPKIRTKVGFDSVSFCACGSAPVSKETVEYLKAALNVGFKQGYGLTESFSAISVSQTSDTDVTSGPISVTTEMRLREVPDMNYLVTDSKTGQELEEPQGELLLRGPQIFPGYYKNKKATTEVLNEEGWFSTGDIAKIDRLGRILIVDRVKNFFKLAQGEYVTPERIENIYLSSCSSLLSQCFVHGDSLQTYLVGILGVEVARLREMLKSKFDVHSLSDEELIEQVNNDSKIKKYLLSKMNRFIKEEGLQGFEKLHNFKIKVDPLRLEDEVVTPTFKIKRANATKFFKDELNELYTEGSLLRDGRL